MFSFVEDSRDFNTCHFTAKGRINIIHAGYMQQQLEKCIELGRINIVINMCLVTFLSSSGIRTVLDIFKKTKALGGKLSIERPSENVVNVLGMVALDEMLLK
ncbi:MAG: STAS domain-containing protein [Oscillospiraceae bacterium]|nr:STAS domain-containing protein [Oscillospiraceae bacterium]